MYELRFIDRDAQKEYLALEGSIRSMVDKGLARLRLRADEIGKPLGGKLQGCRELKFRADGIRVIYRIVHGVIEIVEIITIGARDKERAFKDAEKRIARE